MNIKKMITAVLAVSLTLTSLPVGFISAAEMAPEKIEASKKYGHKKMEVDFISDKEVPKDYTFEKRVVGSAPFNAETNSEWTQYSSYFIYNQLTDPDARKLFYDLTRECMVYLTEGGDLENQLLPGFSIGSLSAEDAGDLYYMFREACPEFYFLEQAYSVNTSKGLIYPKVYNAFLQENDRKTATQEMKTKVAAYDSAASAESTTYNKIKKIHDMLCQNVTYNDRAVDGAEDYMDEEESFSQSAYSTFTLNTTVCEGYSVAFNMLCNKQGIDAFVETSSGHAWNRVAIDDVWYVIDCTWDDYDGTYGVDKVYKYFLRNMAKVKELDTQNAHNTEAYLEVFLPKSTQDCEPSADYQTPGTPAAITEDADAPELFYENGEFTLVADSADRIYYTVDGKTPKVGQDQCFLYADPVAVENGFFRID